MICDATIHLLAGNLSKNPIPNLGKIGRIIREESKTKAYNKSKMKKNWKGEKAEMILYLTNNSAEFEKKQRRTILCRGYSNSFRVQGD